MEAYKQFLQATGAASSSTPDTILEQQAALFQEAVKEDLAAAQIWYAEWYAEWLVTGQMQQVGHELQSHQRPALRQDGPTRAA